MFTPEIQLTKQSTTIIESIRLFINFPFDYNRTAINPA